MKKVKIYTSPICPECERAKKFLKEKQIEYEEIDVFKNAEGAKEMFEQSGHKMVPVIKIDETFFPGFNKDKIEEALKE